MCIEYIYKVNNDNKELRIMKIKCIDASEIEDHFKEVMQEKVDDM
jgi:hypothetical protein